MSGRDLEIFSEMCELAKHVQNHQQIVKAIMDKLKKAIEYTVVVVLLIDEEEIISSVVYPSTRDFLDKTIHLVHEHLPREIKSKKHLGSFKKIIYEDIDAATYEKEEYNDVKTFEILPLTIRDKLYGFFGIASGKDEAFTKRDKNILNIFANQSVILVDNAKLYAQTEQRLLEMSILHEVGKALSSVLNLDKLLNIIIERSVELVRANRISAMLLDEENEKFVIKNQKGLPSEILKNTVAKGEGITGYVASKKEAIFVSDITREEALKNLKNNGSYDTDSFMSFPLIIRHRVVGVLNISDKTDGTHFNKEDFDILDTFIAQARVSIENALLYSEMEQMAVTDGLTHIYNHRYFQEELTREIKRANRYKLNISVIMIDIDFFKQYNDKYGHPKGDQVLKTIATLIKKNVRNVDVAARYGGEEFIVIMPETDKDDAYDVAERIRARISLEQFPGENKKEFTNVTVSVGLASYPRDKAKEKNEIIQQADKALYRAKEEGKNRVCVWTPQET